MTEEVVKFCYCGLPLDKHYNKKYDGKLSDACNVKCKQAEERRQYPKNRRKYGLGGYIYKDREHRSLR